MAKKSETGAAANPLQDALDAGKIKATVEQVVIDDDYLRCTISGVHDSIQRQGRSDEDLIALAVAAYVKHVERMGGA